MNDRTLLKNGAIGARVTAICRFTPALVILLGTVGLSASLAWLDYVLLPAVVLFLGTTALVVMQRRCGVRA